MDDALVLISEMNELIWKALKRSVGDLTKEEIDWRPLPQANSINIIVRHLAIEAQWHLDSLERGEPMPGATVSPDLQQMIDAVPLDFEQNYKNLERLYTRFIEILRAMTLPQLQQRTEAAYGHAPEFKAPAHFLGYHQAVHVAGHCGQISTIRNLYRTTRGEPARFFPENPTYPK